MALLDISGLGIGFDTPAGHVAVVSDVSLAVEGGSCTAIVGESGSGKSQLLMACAGLPDARSHLSGAARFDGEDLLAKPGRFCGRGIGVIFQDASASLTPHCRIGSLLAELHRPAPGSPGAEAAVLEMLARVGLPEPRQQAGCYPHELSGGMRQRVAIAAALMSRPRLLLADEPTSALDVVRQAQVITLLQHLRKELGLALVLVTHDLAVASQLAERIAVMYAGRLVEEGPAAAVLMAPAHRYTAALLAARPSLVPGGTRMATIPGAPPSPLELPTGCSFAPRCEAAREDCSLGSIPQAQGAAGVRYHCLHPAGQAGP